MKETLLFTYSNSSIHYLREIAKEFGELYTILDKRAKEEDYRLVITPVTKSSQLTHHIVENKKDIVLFHFSGHAGPEQLSFDNHEARAEGLAHLLKECSQLRLVMLNGCSTYGQVKALLENHHSITDKPPLAIISTNHPVEDPLAAEFSIMFYNYLNAGSTIRDAFKAAEGDLKLKSNVPVKKGLVRDIKLENKSSDEPLWGLHYTEECALDFILPRKNVQVAPHVPLAAINCDRSQILNQFHVRLKKAEMMRQHAISFLLLNQPNGEVDSLAKRMVIELSAINDNNVKFTSVDSVKIVEIGLEGIESDNVKYRFLRGFDSYLSPHRLTSGSLSDLVEQANRGFIPQISKYDIIPFIFKLRFQDSSLKVLIEPFLKWFSDEFLKLESPGDQRRRFVFIFILDPIPHSGSRISISEYLKQLLSKFYPREDENSILFNKMQQLDLRKEGTPVVILPKLTKVNRWDLIQWYAQFEPEEEECKVFVNDLINRLPRLTNQWNMSEVQKLLKEIVQQNYQIVA